MIASEMNKDLHALIATTIANSLKPLIDKIDSLEQRFNVFQQQLSEVTGAVKKCDLEVEESKQQITRNEAKLKAHDKRFEVCEREVILLQTEKARLALRLQNVPESTGDLKEQIKTLLTPLTTLTKEVFNTQIESVYRVTTVYSKKNKVPREVHIKFTNKALRDEVLKRSNEAPITIGTTKVNILKDIPFLARQKRKKYKVLTKLLIDKKIKYTWCTHEGIYFGFRNQQFKITSETKLRDFLKKYGAELGHKEPDVTDVDLTDVEPTGAKDSDDEEIQGATGLAEITTQLRKYSFRERDK